MRPVCVIFDRLGPYHWARLNAAGSLMPTLGVELFGTTREYAWDRVEGPATFQRLTLFPEREAKADLARRLHQVLHEHQPSAVAIPGWSSVGALAALSWCRKAGRPAIVMSDSQASDGVRLWPKEALKKRVVGMFSAGLVGGIPQADYLGALGMPRGRIFDGYDVIDNEYFASQAEAARRDAMTLRARLHLPENYFLASNRFIEKKNLPFLLRAYDAYRRQAGARAWKLVLLGDGPLMPELLRQREELGLAEDVLFPGFKQYGELPAYYGLAGAFVHASTVEQWGLVVNEAMASGLPVLVSERCGCAPDLVADGKNGFTFDPQNAAALAGLFRRIAENEGERRAMGEASREIIAPWSPRKFAVQLQAAAAQAPGRAGVLDRFLLGVLGRRE